MDELTKVAELLLEKEKIEGDEFDALFASGDTEAADAAIEVIEDIDKAESKQETEIKAKPEENA